LRDYEDVVPPGGMRLETLEQGVNRVDEPVAILVVDDRDENRGALCAMLASPRYRIVDVRSSFEAERRVLEDDFALVLSRAMPEITASVPIVLVTASAEYRAGAVDYLLEPLDPDVVRAKVAIFAELHRQRRRIEEQAARLVFERHHRELDEEFLSIAAHEIKTPLASLKLALQLAVRSFSPDKLEIALRQADRAAKLVDELLDVTRIGSGKLHLDREPVDLAELARGVMTRLENDAAKAHCEVTIAVTPVRGRWDRMRLDQVVTNLLSNAFKYGAGKPVTLTVTAADGRARLVVHDHGIGISPMDASRIFEKFERVATEHAGLGLGLYIAKQIVAAHGGTIGVESRPGHGAKFTLELPIEPPKRAAISEAGRAS
jgi:signal transduction histidine kinase